MVESLLPAKLLIAALPVSPEVAVRIRSLLSIFSAWRESLTSSGRRTRARSLKARLGPW